VRRHATPRRQVRPRLGPSSARTVDFRACSATYSLLPLGPPGCLLIHALHTTYPGSAAVGTVTFDIPRGCLNVGGFPRFLDTGTFTLSTNVGTVSGVEYLCQGL
jgi:hypothetical protein